MIKLQMSETYEKENNALCVEASEKNNKPLFLNECDEENRNQQWVFDNEQGTLFLLGSSTSRNTRFAYFKKNASLKVFNYCDNFYFGSEVEENGNDEEEENEEDKDGADYTSVCSGKEYDTRIFECCSDFSIQLIGVC